MEKEEDKSSRSPATLPEMDPGIWSRLPEELLEHVLSFLPLKAFLKLRSTCKHFNSLISCPSFISKHSPSCTPPFSAFLLLCHRHFRSRYPLFDTTLNSWRKLSLFPCPLLSCTASLLSVSRSLLCFSLPDSSSFLVCNLLSRTSSIVKFPIKPFSFELVTLRATSTGFTLFALCSSNTPFVYDSRSQTWSKFEPFNSIITDNYYQQGVFFKGCVYFTTSEPISSLGFNLETGTVIGDLPVPENLAFARLVSEGEERMYLVGGIGENGIARKIKVWEFGRERRWVEVGSVPEMMCRKFMAVCYHNYEHVYCTWHQGMVCVCVYTWPEVLYYRVGSGTWHWLPKCPALPERWSCGFRWFSLVPELHAFV
ncbi:hypothetical protein NMG60_11031244 [Bertholletia excelsa]